MHIPFFIYLLLLTVGIVFHQFNLPGSLGILTIIHPVFAFLYLGRGIVDLLLKESSKLTLISSFALTLVFLGIALKIGYVAYANLLLMFLVSGMLVLLVTLRVAEVRKVLSKSESMKAYIALVPTLAISVGLLWIGDEAIFHYKNKNLTSWKASDRLVWNDFMMKPVQNSKYDASIYSEIKYQYKIEFGQLKYMVEAYFHQDKSWRSIESDGLLEHEQMHFDITEVYARQLRAYFSTISAHVSIHHGDVRKKVQKIIADWDQAQNDYDHETNHGLVVAEQILWQEKVDSLLNVYEERSLNLHRYTGYNNTWAGYNVGGEENEAFVEIIGDGYTKTEQQLYTDVDVMPRFDGGAAALQNYLKDNINYPTSAEIHRIQGVVYITFVIDKEGVVKDANVLKGIDEACDEEALRVVLGMPRWSPGLLNGLKVDVRYNLPIRFKLE